VTRRRRETMRTLRRNTAMGGVILLALAALVLAVFPGPALACTADDADCDGFTDSEESAGIDLTTPFDVATDFTLLNPDGSPNGDFIPSCTGGEDPALCLDPTKEDLFVIVNGSFNHQTPAELLRYVTSDMAGGGLDVRLHFLERTAGSGRNVTANQKAITVTDDSTPYDIGRKDPILFGITTFGDPNGLDSTSVRTHTIRWYIVEKLCGSLHDNCKDSAGTTGEDLVRKLINYVASHEVGHDMKLGYVSSAFINLYNGNHYPPGEFKVMEQHATYTKKGSKVTFYLADKFHPNSQDNIVLHTY
jgi:hypothetical protein